MIYKQKPTLLGDETSQCLPDPPLLPPFFTFFTKSVPPLSHDFTGLNPFEVSGCRLKHAAHYPQISSRIDQKTGPPVHLTQVIG